MAYTPNKDNISELYSALTSRNVNCGSLEQFTAALDSEDVRKEVYNVCGLRSINAGTYEEFEEAMGFSKPHSPAVATANETAGTSSVATAPDLLSRDFVAEETMDTTPFNSPNYTSAQAAEEAEQYELDKDSLKSYVPEFKSDIKEKFPYARLAGFTKPVQLGGPGMSYVGEEAFMTIEDRQRKNELDEQLKLGQINKAQYENEVKAINQQAVDKFNEQFSEETINASAALHLMERAQDRIKLVENRGRSKIGNAFRGLKYADYAGLNPELQLVDAYASFSLLNKLADNPEAELSESEEYLLQAIVTNNAVDDSYQTTMAERIGAGLPQNLAYMAQFALTGGVGGAAGAAAKKGAKWVIKKGMKNAERRLYAKGFKGLVQKGADRALNTIIPGVIGASTAAAAQTALDPVGLASETMTRAAGTPEYTMDGGVPVATGEVSGRQELDEAFKDAFAAKWAENMSERSGESLGVMLGAGKAVGKTAVESADVVKKAVDKMSDLTTSVRNTKIGGLISQAATWLENKDLGLAQVAAAVGWNGTVEEFYEEQVNTILNAMFVGDEDLSALFDSQRQLETLLSVGVVGGAMRLISAPAALEQRADVRREKQSLKRSLANIEKAHSSQSGREALTAIANAVDNGTVADVASALAEANRQEHLDQQTAQDYLNYATRRVMLNMWRSNDQRQASEISSEIFAEAEARTHKQSGAIVVAEYTDASGNKQNVDIIDGVIIRNADKIDSTLSDRSVVVRMQDGTTKMVPSKDLGNIVKELSPEVYRNNLLRNKTDGLASNFTTEYNSRVNRHGVHYNEDGTLDYYNAQPSQIALSLIDERGSVEDALAYAQQNAAGLQETAMTSAEGGDGVTLEAQNAASKWNAVVDLFGQKSAQAAMNGGVVTPGPLATEEDAAAVGNSLRPGDRVRLTVDNGEIVDATIGTRTPEGNLIVDFDEMVTVAGNEGQSLELTPEVVSAMIFVDEIQEGEEALEAEESPEQDDVATNADYALSRIPMGPNGRNWEAAKPVDAAAAKVAEYNGDFDAAAAFAQQMADNCDTAIAELSNAELKVEDPTNADMVASAQNERAQAIESLTKTADFWQVVVENINAAKAEFQASQGEAPAEAVSAETAPEAEPSQTAEGMPTREDGEPDFISAGIERTSQFLLDELGDDAVGFVQDNIAEAQKMLEEAAAKKATSTNFTQRKQEATAIAEERMAAQARLDFWDAVADSYSAPQAPVVEDATSPSYSLSDEIDENGRPFVKTSTGNIEFGFVESESGLTPAPILLSEGIITNPKTNDGYGLVHIEARHGDQIRNAGYNSVTDFIEEVAKEYTVIREGKKREGQQTYLLQLTDKHNNTLMVELSSDGNYWNINTAGIFKMSYGKNGKVVYNRYTTAKQTAESVEVSQESEQSGSTETPSISTPASPSENKDTTTVPENQISEQEVAENNAVEGIDLAVEIAERATNPEPTEGQKEAGNYKKGHIKIDGFDITIETLKGVVRSGVDEQGNAWSVTMNNTYGYIRGTEGVDGDHIDLFLSDNLDGWNGNVYVIDQVKPDGSFDEHKVMYGFNTIEEAQAAYLSNYSEGWQGLGAITGTTKEGFQKWVASSHRKTKPFVEYKSVKTTEGQAQEAPEVAEETAATQPEQVVEEIAQPSAEEAAEKENAPAEQPEEPTPTAKENATTKIEDFGEKIGGARKDVARQRIKDSMAYSRTDLVNLKDPDKILSRANIIKYVRKGEMTIQDATTLLALNMAVRGGDLRKGLWLEKYRDAAFAWSKGQDVVVEVTDKDVDEVVESLGERARQRANIRQVVREGLELTLGTYTDYKTTYEALNYPEVNRMMKSVYIRVGRHDGKYWVVASPKASRGWPYATMSQAVAKMQVVCPVIPEEDSSKGKEGKDGKDKIGHLHIVKDERGYYRIKSRNIPGSIYLSKRFNSKKVAEQYLKDNAQELVQREIMMTAALMGSNIGMVERQGPDYRNGRDVTPQNFLDTFGVRAVEFGNWVPQAERQLYLNKSYDAIMDLCMVVGISPKAFSLGGRLALAFGSRGKSRALAHYEPLKEVINLTRMKGAGSLAHEWFHALDNYLSRQVNGNVGSMTTRDFRTQRSEVAQEFRNFVHKMGELAYSRRSSLAGPYWYEVWERAARLFESYVYNKLAEQNIESPLLVVKDTLYDESNPLMGESGQSAWPYPSAEENEVMKPYFDTLFDTIQEREENGKAVLYQIEDSDLNTAEAKMSTEEVLDLVKAAGIEVEIATPEMVEEMLEMQNALMEAKIKSPKTVLPEDESSFKGTAVSSDSGAKILQNIENTIQEYENKGNSTITFIGDIASALGIERSNKRSKYQTFETISGEIVTIRISDHNAKTSNFDNNNENNGISIVISRKNNVGIENDGNAHLVEFFYSDKDLRTAEGKPLVDILKSIKQSLYSGEYTDNTGLAKRQEVNEPQWLRTTEGEVYGWVANGKIYLTERGLNPETPIHEYTHIWDAVCQRENPKLWAEGVALMKQIPLWEEVRNNPAYANIADNENALASEVHARLTAPGGTAILVEIMEQQNAEATLIGRIHNWLRKFWRWLRKKEMPESKLNVDKFARMPLKDLAMGKRLLDGIASANDKQKVAGQEIMDAFGNVPMAQIGRRRQEEMYAILAKRRQDLSDEEKLAVIAELDKLDNNKIVNAAFHYFVNGTVRLPEDMPKVEQAVKVAEVAKVDPMAYKSPMELINAHADVKLKEARIDPDTVPTLSNKVEYEDGLAVYDVEDSEESRQNMRRIINTHFGEDSSPWCLLQGDGKGNLTGDSERYWNHYNAQPKRVAFQNGKLLAFFASDGEPTWWDRQDAAHTGGIPAIRKLPDGSGRVGTVEFNEATLEWGEPTGIHLGQRGDKIYEEWLNEEQISSREIRVGDKTHRYDWDGTGTFNGYLEMTADGTKTLRSARWYGGVVPETVVEDNTLYDYYRGRIQRIQKLSNSGDVVEWGDNGNTTYVREGGNTQEYSVWFGQGDIIKTVREMNPEGSASFLADYNEGTGRLQRCTLVREDGVKTFISWNNYGLQQYRVGEEAVVMIAGEIIEATEGFSDLTSSQAEELADKVKQEVEQRVAEFAEKAKVKAAEWGVKAAEVAKRYSDAREFERQMNEQLKATTSKGNIRHRTISVDSKANSATNAVEKLFNAAVAGNFSGKPVSIGKLTPEGKQYLESISGMKLRNNVDFVLNPSDLVHIYNDHFGDNEKDKGRNIPLSEHDIKRMVDVLSFPDEILYGTEKSSGRKLFYFLMDSPNGAYNLLEIYADKKGNLTAKTYYKTKKDATQRVMELSDSLLLTSETYSGAILSGAKIPQMFEITKFENPNTLATLTRTASEDADQRAIAAQAETLSSSEVEEYAKSLAEVAPEGVRVVVTNSIESGDSEHAGWYDMSTDTVYINADMCVNKADVDATFIHEIVGHRSMPSAIRRLIGSRNASDRNALYTQILGLLPEDYKSQVADKVVAGMDLGVAVDEVLAEAVENEGAIEPSVWGKICAAVRALWRKIFSRNLAMSDNDIKYMFWLAAHNLDNPAEFIASEQVRNRLSKKPAKPTSRVSSNEQREYDENTAALSQKITEAWIDSLNPLQKLQDVVSKSHGGLKSWENAYDVELGRASRTMARGQMMVERFLKPVLNAVSAFTNNGYDLKEVTNYMIAKHGLERNNYYRIEKLRELNEPISDFIKEVAMAEAYKDLSTSEKVAVIEGQFADYADYLDTDEIEAAIEWYQRNSNDPYMGSLFIGIDAVPPEDMAGLTGLMESLDPDAEDFTEFAENLVKEFEGKSINAVDTLWNAVRNMTTATLTYQYEGGIISHEQYVHLRSMYMFYIPLRGWDGEDSRDFYEYSLSPSRFQTVVKEAEGRTSLADDPLANMANMLESAVTIVEKNASKQALVRMAMNRPNSSLVKVVKLRYQKDRDPNTGEIVWKVVHPAIKEDATAAEVDAAIEGFNETTKRLVKEGEARTKRNQIEVGVRVLPRDKSDHYVTAMFGGEEVAVVINGNPAAARALNGTNVPKYDQSLRETLGWATRQYAKAHTTWSPRFVLTNFMRDYGYGSFASFVKYGGRYAKRFQGNIHRAAWKLPKLLANGTSKLTAEQYDDFSRIDDQLLRYFVEFLTNGGETGFSRSLSTDEWKKEIATQLDELQGKDPKKVVKALTGLLTAANRWAEDIPRFAAYLTSREMGKNVAESIKDAKEITVNFSRHGSGRYGNSLIRQSYAFVNASIQGSYNFWVKLAKEHPKRFWPAIGTVFMSGFAIPFLNGWLLSLFGDDEDERNYKYMSRFNKTNRLVLFNPLGEENGFVTLPIAHELIPAYALGNIAYRRMGNIWWNAEAPQDVETPVAEEVMGALLTAVPLDFISGSSKGISLRSIVPSIGQPIYDIYHNADFQGRPIYRSYDYGNGNTNKWDAAFTKAPIETWDWLVELSRQTSMATEGDGLIKPGVADFHISDGSADVQLNNPAIAQYLLESYLGGSVQEVTRIGNLVKGAIARNRGDENAAEQYLASYNIPLISGLYKSSTERTADGRINEIYKHYRDNIAKQCEREMRAYMKELPKDVDQWGEYAREALTSEEFKIYKLYEEADREIKAQEKALRAAQNSNSSKGLIDLLRAQIRANKLNVIEKASEIRLRAGASQLKDNN